MLFIGFIGDDSILGYDLRGILINALVLKLVLKDEKAALSYEALKVYIAEELKKNDIKRSFFFPFKSKLGLKNAGKELYR